MVRETPLDNKTMTVPTFPFAGPPEFYKSLFRLEVSWKLLPWWLAFLVPEKAMHVTRRERISIDLHTVSAYKGEIGALVHW